MENRKDFEKLAQHAKDFLRMQNMAEREKESAEEEKRRLEEEKDKRREDWAGTNKWVITFVIGLTAIVAVALGNFTTQTNAFNRELRDVRDRVTEIQVRLQYEKVEPGPASAGTAMPADLD